MGRNLFFTRTNIRRDRRRHYTHFFDTVAKRQKRQLRRKAKLQEAETNQCSFGQLKPTVRCCSNRYKLKCRNGKGFSLRELKESKVNITLAKSLRISVDKRRNTMHQMNVDTLKDFMNRIIISKNDLKNPVLQGHPKILERSQNAQKDIDNLKVDYNLYKLYPASQVAKNDLEVKYVKLTDKMKNFSTVDELIKARKAKHYKNRNKYDKAAVLAEAAKKQKKKSKA
ncbi:MAG: 60S ribosomal protein L13 [Paramarteilia canceri]